MTLTGNEIRQKFLDYFASKNHAIVKSSSLIPSNDPTLYFTNAGMVQFKNSFTGQEKRNYARATSSQKCMRVSGKHNDLEQVGRTARHHTFFEMLGNFSFGDYFKSEACAFAWEFLIDVLKLPKDKLWISIYHDDDQAFEVWTNEVGIPKDRIVRLGEKDNFWSMGETGPCGPCSEIFFEQDIPCSLNNPDCALGTCDCDKFLEIWNLVFMQFERHADGTKTNLPKPSIDTGMGLERTTAVLQGRASNYDCDLFTPIIKTIEKIVQKPYKQDQNDETSTSIRVLADHIRASVFLINDGVLPSNEGRGYVLRCIMRRAIRHGKLLDQTHPFFYRLVQVVIDEMQQAYPELKTNQQTIEKVIKSEEERFLETLEKGLKLLSDELESLDKNQNKIFPGDVAFKLHDTFGFPLDLTELIVGEQELLVDKKAFDAAMSEQKKRARAGWKGSGETALKDLHIKLSGKHKTQFVGYDNLESNATIVSLIQNGQEVKEVSSGDFELICDQTPFYAESGGQVGDKGSASNTNTSATITDTQKPAGNLIVHEANITSGQLIVGQKIQLHVDKKIRQAIMRNHTATHLMHAALRKTLGTHVRQAGSFVNDKVLRFDFSHFEAIPTNVLHDLETQVNNVILDNLCVQKDSMEYDEAINKGALAFFGDKYDDVVRVVSAGDYSTELCGGTHLSQTSEIGCFRILSEGSIAAGVRRIEAITGSNVIKQSQENSDILANLSDQLKASITELPEKIEKLKNKIKSQEKEIEKLKDQLLSGDTNDFLKNAVTIKDIAVIIHQATSAKDTRTIAQAIKDKLKSGIAIVHANDNNKAVVVVTVSQDLQKQYPANKILAPIADAIQGRGGGKADIAQAGGSNPQALTELHKLVENTL